MTILNNVNIGRLEQVANEAEADKSKVKQLIHEGNIGKVRLVHDEQTLLELPLSVGAQSTAMVILAAPVLAALGAFASLVTECTIEVEKTEDS